MDTTTTTTTTDSMDTSVKSAALELDAGAAALFLIATAWTPDHIKESARKLQTEKMTTRGRKD